MVGGLAAAAAARKVVNVVWVAATGRRVPEDPGDPGVSTGEAVAFAAATAATVGAAKLMVARKANALKSNGTKSGDANPGAGTPTASRATDVKKGRGA